MLEKFSKVVFFSKVTINFYYLKLYFYIINYIYFYLIRIFSIFAYVLIKLLPLTRNYFNTLFILIHFLNFDIKFNIEDHLYNRINSEVPMIVANNFFIYIF